MKQWYFNFALISCLLTASFSLFSQNHIDSDQKDFLIKPNQDVSKGEQVSYLQDVFKLSNDDQLTQKSRTVDELGFTHQKLQQYYKGILVDRATVTVHSKQNKITLISNNFYDIEELNVNPGINVKNGFQIALQHVNGELYPWEVVSTEKDFFHDYKKPEGILTILVDFEGKEIPRLAYKYDILVLDPLNHVEVFIDAHTGQFIKEYALMQDIDAHDIDANDIDANDADISASGQSRYNGNVSFTADQSGGSYRLRQAADAIETYTLNNQSPPQGSNPLNYASDITSNSSIFNNLTAVQCHWATEKTHEYFQQDHNYNFPLIKSFINFGTNLVNAFNTGGYGLLYGDGNGTTMNALVTLDIVAHENVHSLTQNSANLVYQSESGALNESFSDIFGETAEKFATNTNNWFLGTEASIGGQGIVRSFANPNQYNQPDTYGGTHWYSVTGCTPSANNDRCGVHINSGVQNKWFYVLSQGESGTNDIGDSYNVSGIGMEKAAKIAYRNLTTYLTANSNYSAARTGAIQAATDLYGANSAEVIATTNAWYSVGVGDEHSGGGGGSGSYCDSKGNSVQYLYVGRVQLGSIDNSTDGGNGYSDHTSISTNLSANSNYTISVTPTRIGEYALGYSAWIDYNQDGDFDDSGEQVWSLASTLTTPATGSFTVPSSALSGSTRLRVSGKYNGVPTSCETFDHGEVEDYTVNIQSSGGGDTQAPSVPTNLAVSNTTQTSTSLSWSASTDNVGVTGYNVYVDGNSVGTTSGTSYNVTGLTASTTYALKVSAYDAAGNTSGQASINVTTLGGGGGNSYCASKGSVVQYLYVGRVQLGSIDNSTDGGNGYSDHTSISTNLSANSNYTISVTPTRIGEYALGYSAWIDYNQDGDFDDSGEQVWSLASTLTTPATGSFTVPSSALSGSTRLRVSGKYNGVPTSCETFDHGEVEDYTVNIQSSGGGDTQAPSVPTNLAVSNTTQTSTSLSWSASTDNVGVTGYNVYVDGNSVGTTSGTSYNVTGLTASTTYALKVSAYDAAGNTSGQASINVTTLSGGDTQAPSVPTNLAVSNTTQTSTSLSWSASTDNVGVTGYNVYVDGNSVGTTSGTSYNVTGLTASTTYALKVSAYDAAGNTSGQASINVTTLGGGGGNSYCASKGSVVQYLYVGRVQLGSIDNSTDGGNGYSDHTSISTNLSANSNYTISVTPTRIGEYALGYSAWIDYNQDGDFDDSGEQVWSLASTLTTPATGSFTVPSSALSGSTRLRVSGKYNGVPTSCETFDHGEVEDYTVNIQSSGGGDTQAPSVPTNLAVSNTTQTSTSLSWSASTDNVGVTGYNVYVDGNSVGTTSGTSYNVTGLTASTTYALKVSAYDAAGNTSGQASINVTTLSGGDTQAPSVPTNLAVSNTTQTSTSLSWSASTDNVGVTGYNVYVDGNSVGTTSGTSYNVTGLTASTTYALKVSAYDAAGNTSGQASINVTTLGGGGGNSYCDSKGGNVQYEYIGRVQLGSIDNSTDGGNGYSDHTSISTNLSANSSYTITVNPTFTGNAYAEGYSAWIDYNQDGDFDDSGEQVWSKAASTGSSVNGSFTVPSSALSGSTRLRVSMKYNGVPTACETFSYGEVEDYTVNIQSSGGGDTQVPSVPTNLAASNTTQTSTSLSWSASTDNVGVTGYNVYVDGNSVGTTSGTSYNVTGLTASTTYALKVSAYDAAGNTSGQASINVTTLSGSDTQAPSVPTNLAVSNTTQTSTSLSWSASTDNVGVTGYNVYVDGNSVGTTSGTSYNVTGLTASTTYALKVSAYDAAGNTSGQASINVTTLSGGGGGDTQAPSVPTNLAVSNTTQTSTSLSWSASTDNVGVTGYKVYVDGQQVGTTTYTGFAISNSDVSSSSYNNSNISDVRTCGQNEHMIEQLKDSDFKYDYDNRVANYYAYSASVAAQETTSVNAACSNPVVIPIAVHYSGLTSPNSACLIQLAKDQVDILTRDFQANNSDISKWTNDASSTFPGVNYGQACIEFRLANKNHPSGSGLSDGQEAVTINQVTGDYEATWSGYLNIFVKETNPKSLGYSPLGGSGNGDGVTMDLTGFGAGTGCGQVSTEAPYDLGRTTVHEVGHYLYLNHLWENDNAQVGCSYDDGVSDTPLQEKPNAGCPSNGTQSCNSADLHMSYLDYVNDACMYMFSAGQIQRAENWITSNLQNLVNNAANVIDGSGSGNGDLTYNVSNLSPGTTYTLGVSAYDAAGNESSQATINVTTLGGGGGNSYCDSKGGNVQYEYIGRVQLGSIDNSTDGGNGYSDHTSISTNLSANSSYTITVNPTFTGNAYAEGYSAWIDYNQDGDFDDSGEQVWSKAASTGSSVNGSFTVPSSALSGSTRLRVSMKYNGVPTACETFSYGEVEDYTVNIQGGSGYAFAGPTNPKIKVAEYVKVYPNPAIDYINIDTNVDDISSIQIFSIEGKLYHQIDRYEKKQIDVSMLGAGIYLVVLATPEKVYSVKFIRGK